MIVEDLPRSSNAVPLLSIYIDLLTGISVLAVGEGVLIAHLVCAYCHFAKLDLIALREGFAKTTPHDLSRLARPVVSMPLPHARTREVFCSDSSNSSHARARYILWSTATTYRLLRCQFRMLSSSRCRPYWSKTGLRWWPLTKPKMQLFDSYKPSRCD